MSGKLFIFVAVYSALSLELRVLNGKTKTRE